MVGARRIGGAALVCGGFLSCVSIETEVPEEGAGEAEVRWVVADLPIEEPRPAEFTEQGEAHCYQIDLETGEFLHVEVEQRGIDIELSLTDAEGRVLARFDSPGGTHSTERLGLVVEETGTYSVLVRPSGKLRGRRYSIHAEEPRVADVSDLDRARAYREMLAGDALRREGSRPSLDRALRHYLRAQKTWNALGEASLEAVTYHRWAQIWYRMGRTETAKLNLLDGLAVIDRLAAPERDAQDILAQRIDVLLLLAIIYREAAMPEEAVAVNEEALSLAGQIGNHWSETDAANNLALLAYYRGDFEDALRYFRQTAEFYKELDHPVGLARSLRKAGDIYILLGNPREALSSFNESLEVSRAAALPAETGNAFIGLGWYHFTQGEYEKALAPFEKAIEVAREADDSRILTGALDRQGSLYSALERYEDALASFTGALQIYEDLGRIQPQGPTLANIGGTYLALGKPEKALEYLEAALGVVRQMNQQAAEADSLLLMARAKRELGRRDAALSDGAMALDIIESLRSDIQDPDDRLLFLARPRQNFYEFNVDLLMEQALSTNDEAYEARAFAIAEKNRARVFLELLGEARHDARREEPLDLANAQRFLDPETIVLTFFLGQKRSFLWRIARNELDTYVLPSRMEIERVAQALYATLQRSQEFRMRAPLRLHVERLSRMILADVEESLDRENLVIVADGALQYVPFAALLKPSNSEPLVVDHEISTLPSVSVLSALRSKQTSSPSSWSVAVIADPVTSRADERLRGLSLPAAGQDTAAGDFPRLEFSRSEAEEIESLLPAGRVFLAVGFAADLDSVLTGAFEEFEVVHFAAHSIIDTEEPERSAIVLSQFDRDGRPRDGLLSLDEIHGLDVPAELVILGACSTALGKEVHGEGLVGLTRGFMYAGASRVLVSLWDVSDQGTSELMKRFYRALLRDGEHPAAALRTAQKSMLGDPMFHEPFYWAPFVLQGDWR